MEGLAISGTRSHPGDGYVHWRVSMSRGLDMSGVRGGGIQRDMVGNRAVRIILECFLVEFVNGS